MGKIITDTNIWYSIGKDYNLFPDDEEVELPLPVLFELLTSKNITKSEQEFSNVKLAIGAILDFQDQVSINHYNPVEILIKKHYPDFEVDSNVKQRYFEEFSAIQELSYKDCKDLSLSRFRNSISTTTEYYNETSKKYNREIKKMGKDNFYKWSTLTKTKQIIIDLINSEIEINNLELPKIVDYDFSKIELFISIFDKHLRDIARTKERVKDNDWNDIFLLTYVEPEFKYWTFEKKWIRKIKELKLDKYLYIGTQ